MIFILSILSCDKECNDVFVVKQRESAGTEFGFDVGAPMISLSCPDGKDINLEDHYILSCTEGCSFNNGFDYCIIKKDLDNFAKNSCCNISKSREGAYMHAELDCDGNFFKSSTYY